MYCKSSKLNTVKQVSDWRLCMGCGACAWACPDEAISLVNLIDKGIRPKISDNCQSCGKCVDVCPGINVEQSVYPQNTIAELRLSWGAVLEVWEGYASDPTIRYEGSSGGIVTALAKFCLEHKNYSGVLHIAPDPNDAIGNITRYTQNTNALMESTGSRYAPASPCEGFSKIENAEFDSLFIGKPCDIAALRMSQKVSEPLLKKTGVAISIFCAGTPTRQGTLSILNKMGISNSDKVKSFRYRGQGWPGFSKAKVIDDDNEYKMTYADAWGGVLSKNGQLRCRLCPDSTGELADISCGDPWYRDSGSSDPGRSLILVRTEKGRAILQAAISAGYVTLKKADPNILPQSQKSVWERRRVLLGRLSAMKVFRVPIPNYKGFHLYENWKNVPISLKIKTIIGTIRRVFIKKWFFPEQ